MKALLFAILALFHGSAAAVACTSIANGNWNVLTTWGPAGTGCAGANGAPAGTPGPGDTVTIATTVTITTNVNASAVTNITGTLRFNGAGLTMNVTGNVTVGAGGQFTLQNPGGANTHTLNIGGNLTNNGTFQMVNGNDVVNVNFNGAGAQVIGGGGATMQFNNLTVGSGGAASFNRSFSVRGNMTDNGNFVHNGAASRVTFNGVVAQSLLGAAANTTFRNVTMAKTGAVATRTLTLGHDLTVVTNLTFQAGGGSGGRIVTGASKVVVQAAGAGAITTACPADTNDFVAGNLQRQVAAGASTVVFPVGANAVAGCRQASLTFAGVGAGGGGLLVSTTAGDHPQIGTSGIDGANSLNRYWTLTTTGVSGTPLPAFASYSATFTFIGGEVDPATSPLAFIGNRFAAGVWNPTNDGTNTATTTTIANETALGELAFGEPLGYSASLGRFNAYDPPPLTPAGSVHGSIRTKVSGTAFTLRVVHLNGAGTALQNFGGNVTVELLDGTDSTGIFANNCWSNWTPIPGASQVINFPGGGNFQSVTFTQNNAWKNVRVRMTSGGQVGCSGDRFAIRPQSFAIDARDADWATAGTTRVLNATAFNGAPAHKAGQFFTLRVISTVPAAAAANYLAAGNHTGTPGLLSAACVLATGGAPACTTACATGTLTPGVFAPTVGPAALTSSTAGYTEAGVVDVTLQDTAFANVDLPDTPLATRTVPQTAALRVGRFVPDNFLAATNNAPQFQTFGSACAAPRRFTYVGQPFGYVAAGEPQVLVTAREAGGATTANYRECLWKISTAAPTDVTQTYTNVTGPVVDTALAGNAPTIVDNLNGTGTVTVSSMDRIAYTRSTVAPIAPFSANITLAIQVRDDSDPDGQITSNTASFDGGGPGIAFDGLTFLAVTPNIAGGRAMVYGRARMVNAVGSEKLPLPVPLRTEFWTGTGFVTNTDDSCTSVVRANFALGGYTGNLNACETIVTPATVSFASGVASMSLTAPCVGAPCAGNDGSVLLTLNLGGAPIGSACTAVGPAGPADTPASMSYLQGAFTGTAYNQNPFSRAAFGLYGAQPSNFIYFRENF